MKYVSMTMIPQGSYERKYLETERYLFSYQDAMRERNSIKVKLDILREEMMPKSPAMTGMPGSSNQDDKMAAYIARVEEYTHKLQAAYDKAFREMVKIESIISLVDDSVLRQLMTYRYLKNLRWEDIAELMNYSEQRMYQLRVDALREAARVIDDGK